MDGDLFPRGLPELLTGKEPLLCERFFSSAPVWPGSGRCLGDGAGKGKFPTQQNAAKKQRAMGQPVAPCLGTTAD